MPAPEQRNEPTNLNTSSATQSIAPPDTSAAENVDEMDYTTVSTKIAIWGWQTPQLPTPEKAPKYLELMLSNMLRPTFVPNLVVLTWTRASAAPDWLTLPLSIKTTRPDPSLHPHPPIQIQTRQHSTV